MGQGQIRKGFFFYFGLFILLLIAIFMCCLVVMMFNPGKTILWMQYFTASDEFVVEETTDENPKAISLSNLTDVDIKCSFANVSVIRSKDRVKDGIYIINNAKGFTVAKDVVHFSYSAKLDATGKKLTIEITEPSGFLYLSKDIQVVVNAFIERDLNFNNLNLNVTTTSGEIQIGGGIQASEDVKLKGLNLTTTSGKINLTDDFDTSTLTSLNLKTNEGAIESFKKVNFGTNQTATGLDVNCDVNILASDGRINFGILKTNGTFNLTSTKADVNINYLYANSNINCSHGNYRFKEVHGNLDFAESEDYIQSPNVYADLITGYFNLYSNDGANPIIKIKQIDGDIDITTDNGSVDIDEANGQISILSNGELGVNVVVGQNNTDDEILISCKSGAITLGFLDTITGNVTLKNENANITINVTDQAKFISTAYLNNNQGASEQNKVADNKIHVNWGTTGSISINPFEPNKTASGQTGVIEIYTNKDVYYNLKSSNDIAMQ